MNMETKTKLDNQIITIISEEADFPDPITPGLVFYDDIPVDSLDVVELTMRLEEEFDIDLANDEERLQLKLTVGELIELVRERIASSG